jgi:DNA-binding MarR family transcriptional regulator
MVPTPRTTQSVAAPAAALARVAPLVTRWTERLLAEHDPPLTLAQYLVLEALARGRASGAELARQAAVSAAAVSQLVAALEQAGLVERASDASGDRRSRPLTLTKQGSAVLRSARRLLDKRLSEPLRDLPPPEGDALARSLEAVEALLLGTAPPARRRPPRPPGPPRRPR